MSIVINSFETMQKASGDAIDVSSIQQAREELARAETAFGGIEESIRKANEEQQNFNKQVQGGSSGMDNLVSKIKSMVSAYTGIQGLKAAWSWGKENMELADTQRNVENQLKAVLSNVGAEAGSFDLIKDAASSIQGKGIYGDEAMLGGAAELATYLSDPAAIQSMMGTLSNYAMGMSGGGAIDTQGMVDYATQLGKALDGTFDGLTKKGFTLTDAQKEIIENGTDMERALVIDEVISQSWDGLYESMSNTPEGQILSLQNAYGDLRETLGNQLYPAVLQVVNVIRDNWPKIEKIANAITQGLRMVITVLSKVIGYALQFGGAIVDNWSWIAPIILGIAAAYGVLKGAMLVYNTVQAISNALMKANPIVRTISLVILFIGVIYAVCTGIAKANGIAESGFGMICGGINVAIQAVKNAALWVANVAVGIWNAFWACIENIKIAFHNGICNIQSWWWGLLATVMNVVAGICAALNKLPFIEFDYSGVTSLADNFANKAAEAAGNKQEYVSIGDAWNSGFNTFSAFEDGWAQEAYKSGAAWGDGVANKVSSMFDAGDLSSFDTDELLSNVDATADNTGAMADSMDFAEEDLKYLRDIAEREAINRFTTAEITVNQTNQNHISSGMDLDGIMDRWSNDFSQVLLTTAEGVHN